MLSWSEYIDELLDTPTVLDKVLLKNSGNRTPISPIIKASILMLESMISTEGRHNVFVFPEIKTLAHEFVVAKTVFNVAAGKINIAYNPRTFVKGQKLKYKNCVVEFDSLEIDKHTGIERVYITFKDGGRYGVPSNIAPIFQIAESDIRRFSTSKAFHEVFSAKRALLELEQNPEKRDVLNVLMEYKTHLDGSIFFVTNQKLTREYFDETSINDVLFKDALLLGKARIDGDIESLYAGQLSGNPAIVLASDFYAVQNAINRGAKIQSVIVDLSQGNMIVNQLDVFDELLNEDFPVLLLTDTKNSFDLDVVIDRSFNLWRWDASTLSARVQSNSIKNAGKKIKNCAEQNIIYEKVDCEELTRSLTMLYKHKQTIVEQSTDMISVHTKLFSLLFVALRNATPFETDTLLHYQELLACCQQSLNEEKYFVSQELYQDMLSVVDDLKKVFCKEFNQPKVTKIEDIILSKKYNSICIVISDKLDKNKCDEYWRKFILRKRIKATVKIYYPQEYCMNENLGYDVTIIVGWLNNKKMRDLIFNFGTTDYIVLTFSCEEKWRRAHIRCWSYALDNSCNQQIVKKALSKKCSAEILDFDLGDKNQEREDTFIDELTEIETLVQTNTYRQYGYSSAEQSQVVNAYPINFVGGYLAFYKTGHKVITLTDVILYGKEAIVSRTPEELKNGDFVAVRESDRDIIKDIADQILNNSGKTQTRATALRWKEALNVATLFKTTEEIYEDLREHGCTKGFQAVKNWIEDEEQFSLRDKDDLLHIAKALEDEVLLETIDQVFQAGLEVKRAHIQAGQFLSKLLKKQVVEELSEYGEIDAFNIWDPITLDIEGIGKVKVLKIIDINPMIQINSGNTNRLLNE